MKEISKIEKGWLKGDKKVRYTGTKQIRSNNSITSSGIKKNCLEWNFRKFQWNNFFFNFFSFQFFLRKKKWVSKFFPNLIEFCLVIVSFTIFCNPNTIWYVLYPSFTLIHQFISIFGIKVENKSFALHKIIIFIFLAYPVDSISFNIIYPSIYKNINVYMVYLIQCAFICGLFAFLVILAFILGNLDFYIRLMIVNYV
jgi:hypothetical protein